jgi:serine protease
MTRGTINRLVQLVMAGALVVTGLPLVAGILPRTNRAVPSSGWNVVPDATHIVVNAKDSLTPAQLDQLNRRYGLDLHLNSAYSQADELLTSEVAAEKEQSTLEALRKDPLVESADVLYDYSSPDLPFRRVDLSASAGPSGFPNDPLYGKQWNLKMVDAEKAWSHKATGKGVVVAVIDTGVAFENDNECYQAKDFAGTHFTPGYDFVNDDDHPFDDHGHGTHVAGTIAETTNNGEGAAGLAFDATIMPLKVLSGSGSGNSADIADAIRYAADHGANIINMSLGSPFPDRVMHQACQYAAKKGVLIVCAAGNSGGAVGYPAGFKECLAVSSVGPNGEIAPYSSRGKEIAIAAPGGDTRNGGEAGGILQNTLLEGDRSTDGYYSFQGTSMASPHVAAAAALVMSRGIKDPAEVKEVLQRAATPKSPEVNYGAGILNADRAVADADQEKPHSLRDMALTLFIGGGLLWLYGAMKGNIGAGFKGTSVWVALLLGYFGPDALFPFIGFASPFSLVLHSALIPLYLLWEAESKSVYRFVSGLALGAAVHLAWDAFRGIAAFPGINPGHAMPWLWVNVVVGLGVAVVAYARSTRDLS